MVQVTELGKQLKGFQLQNITFSLPAGYIMGLVGENGAGKTTLLRILSGLYAGDAGTVRLFEKTYEEAEQSIKDQIGTVFHEEFFDLYETLEGNANRWGSYYSHYDSQLFLRTAERFALDIKKKVKQLSKGEKLKFLDVLYENHIEMNGQIVVCKNVNDGKELERTIDDLSKFLPFMRSVSAVPAGITKYRKGLYPLELFTKEEAGQVIDMIEICQKKYYEEFGLHFIHASDEWYILAGREFPEEERYDGYIQLENGVGMMRLLINEFQEAVEELRKSSEYERTRESFSRTVTIATGKLTYQTICSFAEILMEEFQGLTVHVYAIRNDFFGETITVSGLITGQDLIKQLKEIKESGVELGDTLLIPGNMLRSGEQVFLDDLTVEDVKQALEMDITAVESGGKDLIDAILNVQYAMERDNENFVYIQAYDRD